MFVRGRTFQVPLPGEALVVPDAYATAILRLYVDSAGQPMFTVDPKIAKLRMNEALADQRQVVRVPKEALTRQELLDLLQKMDSAEGSHTEEQNLAVEQTLSVAMQEREDSEPTHRRRRSVTEQVEG